MFVEKFVLRFLRMEDAERLGLPERREEET